MRFLKVFLVIALLAVVGYLLGFRLSEEKRGRMHKLMCEAREMPFRIFV